MAHQLESTQDMIYADYAKPWHGLGIPVNGLFTSKDALSKANLDFEVVKKPIFRQTVNINDGLDVQFQAIENMYETVRTDNDRHLGVVGKIYTPFQNTDVFDFMDSIVGEKQAIYDTAGSLFGGKKIWLLAKLPQDMIVKKENVERFLLLMNSHDGSTPITAFFTPVRVVCNNTLNVALHKGGIQSWVKVRHTTNATSRMQEGARILGISMRYFEASQEIFGEMANFKITPKTLKKYYDIVLPISDDASERSVKANTKIKDQLIEMFENSPAIKGTEADGNLWGAYNAVAEYVQYHKTISGEKQKGFDQRFSSVLLPNYGAYAMRQSAYNAALDMLKN